MLESLLVTDRPQRNLTVFIGSMFFTAVALFAAKYMIPFQVGSYNLAGLIAVLITALALAYPLSTYMREIRAEEETHRKLSEKTLLHRHIHEIEVYLSFFAGCFTVFALSTFLFTPGFYSIQSTIIGNIQAASGTGNLVLSGADLTQFLVIAANNLRLFYITFLLTFFVTGGMVFILVWNASVFGVFIAKTSESLLHLPLVSLLYLPHGILEIGAYIAAGIGGILFSREVESYFVENSSRRNVFFRVWKDVWILLLLGSVTIVFAGFIEVV